MSENVFFYFHICMIVWLDIEFKVKVHFLSVLWRYCSIVFQILMFLLISLMLFKNSFFFTFCPSVLSRSFSNPLIFPGVLQFHYDVLYSRPFFIHCVEYLEAFSTWKLMSSSNRKLSFIYLNISFCLLSSFFPIIPITWMLGILDWHSIFLPFSPILSKIFLFYILEDSSIEKKFGYTIVKVQVVFTYSLIVL